MTMAPACGTVDPVWSFERFEPGSLIGTRVLAVDTELLDRWEALFGPLTSRMTIPIASIPLLIMRAFADTVVPRPPGNLHVAQRCEIQRLPMIDETMEAIVVCQGKELRGERRVVHFDIRVQDGQGQPLFSGTTTIFWAI